MFFNVYFLAHGIVTPSQIPGRKTIPRKAPGILMRLRVYFVPFKVVASGSEPAYRGGGIISFALNPFEACRT
jgi:hypothetical protein